jgi:predicted helicase
LLVKNKNKKAKESLHYFDIGDHLDREEKLLSVKKFESAQNMEWQLVTPNSHNDWVNQRSEEYETFLPLGNKATKGKPSEAVFNDFTQGIITLKDSWIYNFSKTGAENNVSTLTTFRQNRRTRN